jgi:hypothetical protein
MSRYDGVPPSGAPEFELLSDEFWRAHGILSDNDPFPVFPHTNEPYISPVRDHYFYVWRPDFEKIFGLRLAPGDTTEPSREKLEKSGRPPTIQWQKLREEIVRRCWRQGRLIALESQTDLVTELREWHKRELKFEPNDLRKFVGDAIAILKLVGK